MEDSWNKVLTLHQTYTIVATNQVIPKDIVLKIIAKLLLNWHVYHVSKQFTVPKENTTLDGWCSLKPKHVKKLCHSSIFYYQNTSFSHHLANIKKDWTSTLHIYPTIRNYERNQHANPLSNYCHLGFTHWGEITKHVRITSDFVEENQVEEERRCWQLLVAGRVPDGGKWIRAHRSSIEKETTGERRTGRRWRQRREGSYL
jgi:hypothetical protein